MVPDGEVNDLSGVGHVQIDEIELSVCLRTYVVPQSHRSDGTFRVKAFFVLGSTRGLGAKKRPLVIHGLPEPVVEI